MIVDCLSCGATYNISDDKVRGRRVRVRCKSCGDGIIVDGAQLAAEDATRVYSPSFESESAGVGDATRVYSANFEPAAYAAAEGRDESTRVMSSPAVDWQQPEAGEWTVNLSDTEQRTMGTDELVRGYNSGTIGDDAFVWRDGMTDWLPIMKVPELRSAVDSAEATRVVSPAVAVRAPLGRAPAQYTPPPAPVFTPPPAPVTYSAPVAPPRAVQWSPAPEASVEYAPPRPPPPSAIAPVRASAPPAARAAPPARVREGRPPRRGPLRRLADCRPRRSAPQQLVLAARAVRRETHRRPERKLRSLLARHPQSRSAARRAGEFPPRLPHSSPQTAADILGLSAGGAFSGIDATAALLSAPAVEAPAPIPVADAPQQRSRMDTTPPASRGKGQLLLIAAVVVGAVAVTGGAFVVLRSRLSGTSPSASAEPTTGPSAPTAPPPSPVAAAPTTRVATAAPEPAPMPAAPAAVVQAPQAVAAPAPAVALVGAPKSGSASQTAKIEAMKAALVPDDATKGTKAGSKVVLAEEPSGGAAAGGGDTPAPAEEKVDEPPKPPFDTGAAKAALESASASASSCKKPDGPTGRGKVQITFSPSGRATSANVTEGAFGGTPTGGCVAKIFRSARVPAFSGDPVSVSKSFNIPE